MTANGTGERRMADRRRKTDRRILVAVVLLMLAAVAVYSLLRWAGGQELSLVTDRVFLTFILLTIAILAVALVFVLLRNLVKLLVERRRDVLGSRFRTKLVFSFLVLCLIPSVMLFYAAITVIEQTVDGLFTTPVEELTTLSKEVADKYNDKRRNEALQFAQQIAREIASRRLLSGARRQTLGAFGESWLSQYHLDFVAVYDEQGRPMLALGSDDRRAIENIPAEDLSRPSAEALEQALTGEDTSWLERMVRGHRAYAAAGVPSASAGEPRRAVVSAGYYISEEVANRTSRISKIFEAYHQLKALRAEIKRVYIAFFLLLTLLILLSATWLGMYLARQITVPIQALAEGTREVAAGNLDYRVEAKAGDEIGVLIDSFNRMTGDLSRKEEQLGERRRYIETLLENVPAGVLSLDPEGRVTTVNRAACRLLGITQPPEGSGENTMERVFPDPALQPLVDMLRDTTGAEGIGGTRELTIATGGRTVNLAVTVANSRDDEGRPLGALVVLEDLTLLIRAQKSAAWREAARRIAHEIKNPLTPIQLSAQRILKKHRESSPDLPRVLEEGTATIIAEVSSLQSMVDEFSRFARIPPVSPSPCDPRVVIEAALSLYDGTRPDFRFERDYGHGTVTAPLDIDQMKRALINLIDNSIAAMEGGGCVTVRTAFEGERGVLRIEVADDGPGISPEDRDRLFLPYFSTKRRGTGLGLAIVNRIVSDHGGTIRVEDNSPMGTRFLIEIPGAGAADAG